jgi:hypothetical protein
MKASTMLALAVAFPDLVLAVHIAAVVVGFGVSFAYPVMYAVVRRSDPRALPGLHRTQIAVGQRITGTALGVIILAGLYLAAHDHAFGRLWVLGAIAVALVIGLLGALVIRPAAARLLELAERDLATAGPTEPAGPQSLPPSIPSNDRRRLVNQPARAAHRARRGHQTRRLSNLTDAQRPSSEDRVRPRRRPPRSLLPRSPGCGREVQLELLTRAHVCRMRGRRRASRRRGERRCSRSADLRWVLGLRTVI